MAKGHQMEWVVLPKDVLMTLYERKEISRTHKALSIKYFWIDETEVSRYDEAVPNELPLVKGTLKIHQIVADKAGMINHRELSCFCSRINATCECGPSVQIEFQTLQEVSGTNTEASVTLEPDDDLSGKFVVVLYDGKPIVGQVLGAESDELEVNCMHQCGTGKNAFVWPETPDKLFYFTSDVKAIVSEPEPLTLRKSKLTTADWEKCIE